MTSAACEVTTEEQRAGWMRSFVERVFTPIEQLDWKVEKISMHPVEYAELQKHVRTDALDVVAVQELIEIGLRAHIFGASVFVDASFRQDHYEVHYGANSELKNVVCLKKNTVTGEDCPSLECLVDAVHDF